MKMYLFMKIELQNCCHILLFVAVYLELSNHCTEDVFTGALNTCVPQGNLKFYNKTDFLFLTSNSHAI
jgi:hypothetical protein